MTNNNRSLTLEGANKVFGVLGICIEKHELGYFYARWNDQDYQEKTLAELCQKLLLTIHGGAS